MVAGVGTLSLPVPPRESEEGDVESVWLVVVPVAVDPERVSTVCLSPTPFVVSPLTVCTEPFGTASLVTWPCTSTDTLSLCPSPLAS